MKTPSALNASHSELIIKQEMGTDLIVKECCEQLNELFKFEVIAFLLIDEHDHSFHLKYCEPATQTSFIQVEVDYLIEQGFFSWSLSQAKAVAELTQDGKQTLILHPLSTRSRIRGMFVGIVDNYETIGNGDSLNLFNVILLSTSNMLENYELYRCIHDQNRQLEETIKQRTLELEKARIAAEHANEAKSQFLANISHEIRTPLTAILGYADLIRYGQLSADEQDLAVKDILEASTHLSGIINDILDISKIEANKLEIELIPTCLFHLLNELVSIIQGKAKEKGLTFKLDYHFPLPEWIITDPTRLKQILLNLCNNAVKFTDEGEICISVSYYPDSEQIIFIVADTGIGIPIEQQGKLFQKFVQADSSTTRCYGGSGLGLAISKQLTEKLGGSITLQSAPGEGSRFKVSTKIRPVDKSSLIYSLDDLPEQETNINPWSLSERLFGNVLLVEDNINNQQLISLFLTKAGISVDVVDNGNEVIEKALVNGYDLILMDMQMPGMSGIEATKLLREVGYGGPIVALTANATVEIKHQCHEVGFDGFLSKPIEVDSFFNALSRFLKTSSTLAEAINLNDPDFQLILQEFIRSLPKTFENMEREFNRENWPALKSLAHQLKGVAGGYGFPDLGKSAASIETDLENAQFKNMALLLNDLKNHLAKIKR